MLDTPTEPDKKLKSFMKGTHEIDIFDIFKQQKSLFFFLILHWQKVANEISFFSIQILLSKGKFMLLSTHIFSVQKKKETSSSVYT